MTTNTLKSTLIAGLAAATLATPSAAFACGGAWYPYIERPAIDYRPIQIPRAEKALDDGEAADAAGIVIRVIPHIRQLDPTRSRVVGRATRVLAVIAARHGGRVPVAQVPRWIRRDWEGRSSTARTANLRWAAASLGALHQAARGDTALETEYAEALAQLPDRQDEARRILERLAKQDLVSSAEGYAALARLRGVSETAQAAAARCRAMARTPEVCDVRSASTASAGKASGS